MDNHFEIIIIMDLYVLDGWNEKKIEVFGDEEKIFSLVANSLLYDENDHNFCGKSHPGNSGKKFDEDRVYTIYKKFSHNKKSIKIQITHEQSFSSSEIGIRNLFIYINTCHKSCKSCHGENYDDCDSCNENAKLILSKCLCEDNLITDHCIDACPENYQTNIQK